MYFSKVLLKPDKIEGIFREVLKSEKSQSKEGIRYSPAKYEDHQLVWKLFWNNPDMERNFLFRKEMASRQSGNGRNFPVFYVLSEHRPTNYEDWFHIETKLYAPILATGDRLHFSLRVNPVISKPKFGDTSNGDNKRKSARHDVLMNAKHLTSKNYDEKYGEDVWKKDPELYSAFLKDVKVAQEKDAKQWLIKRGQNLGFELSENGFALGRIDFMQDPVHGRKKKLKLVFVDYEGVLTVTDSEQFIRTLTTGIGKSKGLGCGMFLVKRV